MYMVTDCVRPTTVRFRRVPANARLHERAAHFGDLSFGKWTDTDGNTNAHVAHADIDRGCCKRANQLRRSLHRPIVFPFVMENNRMDKVMFTPAEVDHGNEASLVKIAYKQLEKLYGDLANKKQAADVVKAVLERAKLDKKSGEPRPGWANVCAVLTTRPTPGTAGIATWEAEVRV